MVKDLRNIELMKPIKTKDNTIVATLCFSSKKCNQYINCSIDKKGNFNLNLCSAKVNVIP